MSNEMELSSKKIQALRAAKCWSQEELAGATSLSVRTIQRVEKTGNASLETTKALSAVFGISPQELQESKRLENRTFDFILKYAWLVSFALASLFFGLWIVDILIPTLKGADFNQQYEMHGNFRYLDYGGLSFFAGFVMLGCNICFDHFAKKRLVS